VTLLLHLAAVFVLFKAVIAFLSPSDVSSTRVVFHMSREVGLLTLLLASVTVAARLPRLVKRAGWRWHGAALAAFLIGAVPCWLFLPQGVAQFLGQPFVWLVSRWHLKPEQTGIAAVLLVAAVLSSSGWIVPRRPLWGRRTLIVLGTAIVFFMVGIRLYRAQVDAPAWPLVLAGLAFLYLWWLGILLFDLAFIWHRYIRQSVAVDTLGEWYRGRDAQPNKMMIWRDVPLRARSQV
jgi:hypothetical protein